MKKLLLGMVAIFATTTFASNMMFDVDAGYVYGQGGTHSMNIAPGFYYNVANFDGFVKNIAIGGTLDYTMGLSTDPMTHSTSLFVMGRLEMDYNLVYELGLGYGFGNFSDMTGNLIVKTGVAYYYPINDTMKIGAVADFNYTIMFDSAYSNGWSLNVGPSFAMSL